MINDLFSARSASPMLLSEREPFDSEDYLYELKLDGVRALAYLDNNMTDIRNKRNKMVSITYPELNNLHKIVKKRCIIDGELIVATDGKPDFFAIQRRSLMTDTFRIELAMKSNPVRFVAYDILYLEDKVLTNIPLIKRKELLESVINESDNLAITRYIKTNGIAFYNLAVKEKLEGVVAKKLISYYYFGKRSKDWVKFKYLYDSEFVICGYVKDGEFSIKSIALGAYKENILYNQGHVSLGIPKDEMRIIILYANNNPSNCPYDDYSGDKETIYMVPNLVCTVKYMMRTESHLLRQPVYKGLRPDKRKEECILKDL